MSAVARAPRWRRSWRRKRCSRSGAAPSCTTVGEPTCRRGSTIARNKHTDLIRRQVLDDDIREEWQEAPDDHPGVEASLHLEQSRHILHKALQGLRGEQEQVIRKAFSEAKSHQEIAVELGLPLGTVKSRIRLALEHLRATLPLAELR